METAPIVPAEDRPEELLERVQELQDRLDTVGDPATRKVAEDLVSAVVQVYGAGLERILERMLAAGEAGEQIAVALTDDQFLATLLLIHDLHPVPLETRVQEALDSVRPYMESHGGNVELLSLDSGIARIHLRGSCSDCAASAVTLELAIKQALEQSAPDLEGLEVEGVAPQTMDGIGLPMVTGSAPPTGMELPVVMSDPPAAPSWFDVEALGEFADGSIVPVAVAGNELMIANVDGTLLAYRDKCAGCGAPLHDGDLRSGALSCRRCERSFFLPRAGRSMDDEGLQLEPIPLLRDRDRVKVALAA
jgi:Fe-S cluster biogenesis protein NfuA/nitrite reductase/ring-hydroxylating ferredoxin subunit